MLPIIKTKRSPIMIVPALDLNLTVLDVFIKSLHSWIDSNRLFGVNFLPVYNHRLFFLMSFVSPCLHYCIGNLLLLIRHTVVERLERQNELL